MQLPHLSLPSTEDGLLRHMPTPYKTVLSVAATAAFFIGIPSVTGHLLDNATRHQCLTHDWPVHKHQNMMNFCDAYGYSTELGQL